jgi:hypothetical protein
MSTKGVSAVKLKKFGWAVQAAAAIGGAWLVVGCGHSVTATSGTVFRPSTTTPDALTSALAASASHDLPCSSADLDVERLGPEREYAVTGCGARVLYRVLTPTPTGKRVELVSRAAAPGEQQTASTGEQASPKVQ